jgi:hypothetical protein
VKEGAVKKDEKENQLDPSSNFALPLNHRLWYRGNKNCGRNHANHNDRDYQPGYGNARNYH